GTTTLLLANTPGCAVAKLTAIAGNKADFAASGAAAELELATTLIPAVESDAMPEGSEVCPLAGLDKLKVAEAAITATKTGDKRIVFT
ncbi:MAG TPA: hypothetical protein V6D04_02820, partial [Candidatus Obscuribacterales bacterium]